MTTRRVSAPLKHLGLVLIGFVMLYPVLWMVVSSLRPGDEIFRSPGLVLDGLGRLEIRGLMTVGRLVERAEDARPTFAALRTLASEVRRAWPGLGPELSMGMSDDYGVAIEEGATIVRVGRAIFGERPHR